MADQRKIPVTLPGDEREELRYWLEHHEMPEPDLLWLDPDTQVIVEQLPNDNNPYSTRTRQFPKDLDRIIIRPPRKRFKQGKTFEVRFKPDLTVTKWVRTGQADPRCKMCKRFNRYNRRAIFRVQMSACRKHGGFKETQVPHPYAGEVAFQVSTVKLYGLPTGTEILYRKGSEWVRGTVYEYEPWRELDRAKAKQRRKAENAVRRELRRPSRYDRVLQDDGWLKAEQT